MQLHANEIRHLQERMVDLVTKNKITFILPKAPPVVASPEPSLKIVDYIGLMK